MIILGHQLRAARTAAGWSREALAERASVHPRTVAYWERAGAPREPGGHARAPGRMLAALRAAGVEIATTPRPAVFFDEAI